MLFQYSVGHVDGLELVVFVHIRVSHALELALFSFPYCIRRKIKNMSTSVHLVIVIVCSTICRAETHYLLFFPTVLSEEVKAFSDSFSRISLGVITPLFVLKLIKLLSDR